VPIGEPWFPGSACTHELIALPYGDRSERAGFAGQRQAHPALRPAEVERARPNGL